MTENERLVDGCTDCEWVSEPGDLVNEDKCPQCGKEGSMLRGRDFSIDESLMDAAYRFDAFNEGVEWADANPPETRGSVK